MRFKLIEVEIYRTKEGKEPYANWESSLKDSKTRAIVRARINRIRLGNFGDCEPVGKGVYELRIHHGPGYRVYFGRQGNKLVILLTGGSKSSQKRDIKRANEYWLEYKSNK